MSSGHIQDVINLLNKWNYNETTLEEEKELLWKMESVKRRIENNLVEKEQNKPCLIYLRR